MGWRTTAVALLAALLGAVAAAAAPETAPEAQPPDGGPAIHTERRMSEFAPDALPTPFSPYHMVRAQAAIARAFEFFGDAEGFKLGADLLVVEVEAGAALRMLDHLRLTASYRLLDVDLGEADENSASGIDPGLAAPFVGIAFDF
jgi:hypothetical protein